MDPEWSLQDTFLWWGVQCTIATTVLNLFKGFTVACMISTVSLTTFSGNTRSNDPIRIWLEEPLCTKPSYFWLLNFERLNFQNSGMPECLNSENYMPEFWKLPDFWNLRNLRCLRLRNPFVNKEPYVSACYSMSWLLGSSNAGSESKFFPRHSHVLAANFKFNFVKLNVFN